MFHAQWLFSSTSQILDCWLGPLGPVIGDWLTLRDRKCWFAPFDAPEVTRTDPAQETCVYDMRRRTRYKTRQSRLDYTVVITLQNQVEICYRRAFQLVNAMMTWHLSNTTSTHCTIKRHLRIVTFMSNRKFALPHPHALFCKHHATQRNATALC